MFTKNNVIDKYDEKSICKISYKNKIEVIVSSKSIDQIRVDAIVNSCNNKLTFGDND